MKEAKKGLDVTEMFKYIDYKKYLDGQLFFSSRIINQLDFGFKYFLENLVSPLWTEITHFFPHLKHLLESLQKNIKILETQKSSL